MSATSANISSAAWLTRRLVRNEGILFLSPRLPRGGEPPEVVAGVMRRARERARRHHQEALGIGDRLVGLELVRRHEARHRVVLAGGLQVLADGEEIDVRG